MWVVTRTVYDELSRAVFATDEYVAADEGDAGSAVRGTYFVYDALGRVVRTERHEGVAVDLEEDPYLSELKVAATSFDFGSHTPLSWTETHYDLAGNVLYTLDQAGARTDFYYDLAGRCVAVLGPALATAGYAQPVRALTEYEYDAADNLTKVTTNVAVTDVATPRPDIADPEVRDDSAARATATRYDRQGRATAIIHADGTSSYITYDAFGRVASETDQLGARTNSRSATMCSSGAGRSITTTTASRAILQRTTTPGSPASPSTRTARRPRGRCRWAWPRPATRTISRARPSTTRSLGNSFGRSTSKAAWSSTSGTTRPGAAGGSWPGTTGRAWPRTTPTRAVDRIHVRRAGPLG